MPQAAYDSLAEWFEYLNDDCDYQKWSQYFIEGLEELRVGKNGFEIGCGSGAFCRALAKHGYQMTGADLSAPMVAKAIRLAREEGLNLLFLQMDALKMKTPSKYDFILAPNDCYNYISPDKLAKAFKRAAECLKTGGIFWFDISSPYKIRNKIANNMFADDRDEVTYLSFNSLKEDRVEMDVTLFVAKGNGKYERLDEKHVQYIHEREAVISALQSAGFELLKEEGHLGTQVENNDRLNYICRKK